ncbi:MAG: hypothetical protein PHQ74_12825 [Crocinitomicaceae bacterium]|nr:hypothetical protein [Crocinitomicaceae bacterium]
MGKVSEEERILLILSYFKKNIYYFELDLVGYEQMTTYSEFLNIILSTGDYDTFIDLVELEYFQRKGRSRFDKCKLVENYFIHLYGKRIPDSNSTNFSIDDDDYNRMMSPGITYLCLNYLKTGNAHFPTKDFNIDNKSNVKNKTGCILVFSIILICIFSSFKLIL